MDSRSLSRWFWLVLLALSLAGCGVAPKPAPEITAKVDGPAIAGNPYVVILGDSIVAAWSQQGITAQPGWVWLGTPQDADQEETSAQVLGRIQQALQYKPKVLIVLAGTWDTALNPYPAAQGVCVDPNAPCASLSGIVTAANAIGTFVILCTVPPWGDGPLADQLDPVNPNDNLGSLNQWMLHYGGGSPGIQPTDPPIAPYPAGMTVLDVHALLAVNGEDGQSDDYLDSDGDVYIASYTVDGVNPNTAGAQVMTNAAATAVAAVIQ